VQAFHGVLDRYTLADLVRKPAPSIIALHARRAA